MNEILICIVSFVFGMVIVIANISPDIETHKEIVKHECAQFSPKTGQFEWLNQPEKE